MSRRDVIRQVPGILGLAVVLLAGLLASPLGAQTLNNTFGGLSQSSDEPIDIESDMLTVYDAKKYATFKGNVKAVQGTTTLRAAELDVHYIGGANKLTGQAGEGKAATAPRPGSARSRRAAASSSPARTIRPPPATGRSLTCRPNW